MSAFLVKFLSCYRKEIRNEYNGICDLGFDFQVVNRFVRWRSATKILRWLPSVLNNSFQTRDNRKYQGSWHLSLFKERVFTKFKYKLPSQLLPYVLAWVRLVLFYMKIIVEALMLGGVRLLRTHDDFYRFYLHSNSCFLALTYASVVLVRLHPEVNCRLKYNTFWSSRWFVLIA